MSDERRVLPRGQHYTGWQFVVDAFRDDPGWTLADRHDKDYTHRLTVGLEGNEGDMTRLQWEAVPDVICIERQPYGVRNIWPKPLTVMFESFSHSKCKQLSGFRDGAKVYSKHVKQYRLPDSAKWKINPNKIIVVCLNKCGGWRCSTVAKFVELFGGIIEEVREKLPDYEIVLRPHPKTRNAHLEGIPKLLKHLKGKGIRVRSEFPSLAAHAKQARAVVAVWGTAATEFISRGVPVVNMSKEDPEGFIADPVALRDVGDVARLEELKFPMTPREFMQSLAQHVFTPEEVRAGDMMRYINAYYDKKN
nr:hypothetical protein TetV2_00439 [Oceanusvirus sp.]